MCVRACAKTEKCLRSLSVCRNEKSQEENFPLSVSLSVWKINNIPTTFQIQHSMNQLPSPPSMVSLKFQFTLHILIACLRCLMCGGLYTNSKLNLWEWILYVAKWHHPRHSSRLGRTSRFVEVQKSLLGGGGVKGAGTPKTVQWGLHMHGKPGKEWNILWESITGAVNIES